MVVMEEIREWRQWEELIPDALALVFRNLSLQEILTVIPRVCKSWGKAVSGPYCWQEIDIEEWSYQSGAEQLDRMLQMLVKRSRGSLRKLCVSGLPSDQIFSFIAENAPSLQSLRIPRSEVSDQAVEQVAGWLLNVTFLDLSYCTKMGARALEAFGKQCKSLVELRRVMHPLEATAICRDDEAHAIATTMPKLRHLELVYLYLTTDAILEILSNCKELEFLDLRGCWNVELDEKFLKEKFTKLKVIGPEIVDSYDGNYSDYCSDYSGSSSFLAWDWEFMDGVDVADYDGENSYGSWDEDDGGINGLEIRIYEGFEDPIAAVDWPPSP